MTSHGNLKAGVVVALTDVGIHKAEWSGYNLTLTDTGATYETEMGVRGFLQGKVDLGADGQFEFTQLFTSGGRSPF